MEATQQQIKSAIAFLEEQGFQVYNCGSIDLLGAFNNHVRQISSLIAEKKALQAEIEDLKNPKTHKVLESESYATCEECQRLCYTGGTHNGKEYICEDCEESDSGSEGSDDSEDEEWGYDCVVCKKHLNGLEMAKCEEREMCAECCVGKYWRGCPCYVCVANNDGNSELCSAIDSSGNALY